ncbi:Tar ligand binding domain-containing protein, partial [Quadrisphaera oryzae]
MIRRFNDLRIAGKLSLGFAVVCLLLLAVSGVGILRLGGSQANLHLLATSGMGSVETSGRTMTAFVQARFDLANAALTPDSAGTDAALKALDADQQALDAQWTAYLATEPATTPAQQEAYTSALAQWRSAVDQLIPLARANDLKGFVDLRAKTANPAAKKALEALSTINKTEADAATTMAVQGQSSYHDAVVLLLGCTVVAIALAVAIALVVARSVTRPLSKVVTVMREVAAG